MVKVPWLAGWFGVVLSAAPAHASPNPGGFWVSVAAEYRRGTLHSEWSGFVALSIPFDHLAMPRLLRGAPGIAEEPPKKQGDPTPPPLAPPPQFELPLPRLTPRLARGAVRRALDVAGYFSTRTRLGGLSTRARNSAALPELRLRTLHSSGQTLRLTPTTDDPYRYTQAGTSELALEARLTWHLDRLVFADEEVSIERLQAERDAAERRLIEHVLSRLASWQRSLTRAADVDTDPEQRETAELEAVSASVELDVLTDGWFSQAIGESEGQGNGQAGESGKGEVHTRGHAR